MKLLKKSCALLLALLMTASTLVAAITLVACGQTNEPSTDTSTDATDAVSEAETKDIAAEALAAIGDIDWGGGEFVVLYADDTGWAYDEEVIGKADASASVGSAVINDAVFERNTLFEDMCNLTYCQVPCSYAQAQTKLTAEVSGGTHSFHFISVGMGTSASNGTGGLLYNFLNFASIDYDAPWWDEGTLNFNLGGNVFFMNGSHNIVDDDMTYVLAFNKPMLETYGFENPYNVVKNNAWTLDYFNNLIQTVSVDNGDGKWGMEDTYGFAASHIIGNTFFYGAGLQYVKNDKDTGEITLALDAGKMEKVTNVLDKAFEMIYEDHSAYMGNSNEYDNAAILFIGEQAMFFSENAYYLRSIASSMEKDFGILPVPKYDQAQDTYHTWVHSVGSTLSMPANVENPEEFEKVLEAYVILSYQTVKPAYYDTLLSSRNVRDPESVEILNVIFANRIYDMAQYYTSLGLSDLFYNCVCNHTDNFVSSYAKVEKRFERNLEQIMKKLENPG